MHKTSQMCVPRINYRNQRSICKDQVFKDILPSASQSSILSTPFSCSSIARGCSVSMIFLRIGITSACKSNLTFPKCGNLFVRNGANFPHGMHAWKRSIGKSGSSPDFTCTIWRVISSREFDFGNVAKSRRSQGKGVQSSLSDVSWAIWRRMASTRSEPRGLRSTISGSFAGQNSTSSSFARGEEQKSNQNHLRLKK